MNINKQNIVNIERMVGIVAGMCIIYFSIYNLNIFIAAISFVGSILILFMLDKMYDIKWKTFTIYE